MCRNFTLFETEWALFSRCRRLVYGNIIPSMEELGLAVAAFLAAWRMQTQWLSQLKEIVQAAYHECELQSVCRKSPTTISSTAIAEWKVAEAGIVEQAWFKAKWKFLFASQPAATI